MILSKIEGDGGRRERIEDTFGGVVDVVMVVLFSAARWRNYYSHGNPG